MGSKKKRKAIGLFIHHEFESDIAASRNHSHPTHLNRGWARSWCAAPCGLGMVFRDPVDRIGQPRIASNTPPAQHDPRHTHLIRKDASELDVTLWFFYPDDPRSTNDHIVVRYTLPVERLLWLNAPRLFEDDVMPQDAAHVAVFGLERAPRGIAASPIALER